MVSKKRPAPFPAESSDRPDKAATVVISKIEYDALVADRGRADKLDKQIDEYLDFLCEYRLVTKVRREEVPACIRERLQARPLAALPTALAIQDDAIDKMARMRYDTMEAERTKITSDDMSREILPFIGEARWLLSLPDSTKIVFDLVKLLGNRSFGDLECDRAIRKDRRPSDEAVDRLLYRVAERRRKEDPEWDYKHDLQDLLKTARKLEEHGIEEYGQNTIHLLSSWDRRTKKKSKPRST